MEDPSGQGIQINDQIVQPLADQARKKRKQTSDEKSHGKKKQKIEDIEELEMIKGKYAEMEKNYSYLRERLNQLERDLEQTTEANRQLQQTVEGQTIMIYMLHQLMGGD